MIVKAFAATLTPQMTESTAGTRPIKVGGRIVGLDIARVSAVVGMVIVNFKITMSAENSGPQWLQGVAALLDGRAAATFVVLAGIGASLAPDGPARAPTASSAGPHK